MSFLEHYAAMWGRRWPDLLKSMAGPTRHVARVNAFLSHKERVAVQEALETLPNCTRLQPKTGLWPPEAEEGRAPLPLYYLGPSEFPNPATTAMTDDGEGRGADAPLRSFYLMDLASVVAAVVLDVKLGHQVADFCAAPGGKALILAEQIGEAGSLTCNDRSGERKSRLGRTIKDYLPLDVRTRVKMTCRDASKFYREPATYDRILVDAPCSSERHLLHPDGLPYLAEWTPHKTKRLATEQGAILSSAIRCLCPGGRVVYSTCSISDAENDGVVSKIIKRNADTVSLITGLEGLGPRASAFVSTAVPAIERTEFGWQILPDRNDGWGPIYFSVLERLKGGLDR